MNEKVENLMLEHLRAIRGDVSRLTDDMRTVRAEITALRQQVSGVLTLRNTITAISPL